MLVHPRFILASSGCLLSGKAVLVKRGRFQEIGDAASMARKYPGEEALDFPRGAMTPGFVDAHCHSELDFCRNKIEYSGNFIEWLQTIRDIKLKSSPPPTPNPIPSLKALMASGVTTVADHHNMRLNFAEVLATGIRYFGFKEVFQFHNHDPNQAALTDGVVYSFAIHSPYTTSREVALACREFASRNGRALTMHLSEMQAEIEFIKTGKEPFIEELLRKADSLDPSFKGTGKTPIAYFYELGLLTPRTFAVHVNYYEPNDIYLLKRSGATVVYCPKSHDYFRHPTHPVETYLASDINVAIGTDSYASNDSMNILSEMKMVRDKFPRISATTVFKMVTENGLHPLGMKSVVGRIREGHPADFAIFDNAGCGDLDAIFDGIIRERSEADLTAVAGKITHDASRAPAAVA